MSKRMSARRRGFTLVEVMIAMVLTTVIGAAVTSVFVSQSRFYDAQEKVTAARAVSRAAINMMLTELRAIETSQGIIAASQDSLVALVPYALGIACPKDGVLHASIMPVDSVIFANARFAGYAWHDGTTNQYTYIHGGSATVVGTGNKCAGMALPITTFTAAGERGRVVNLPIPPMPTPAAPPAAALLLYQKVTYRFAPSTWITAGQRALWRQVDGRQAEELAAPFDPSARFRFYVLDNPVAQDAPPAVLAELRGVELVMTGRSELRDSEGERSRTTAMRTAIFFRNHLD